MESNIPIDFNGNRTVFKSLPDDVKDRIRQAVCMVAADDFGRNVGQYVAPPAYGKTNHCGDWVFQVYDGALRLEKFQVLRYDGVAALFWGTDKTVNLKGKALVAGTLRDWTSIGDFVAVAERLQRDKTWNNPRRIESVFPRVGPPAGAGGVSMRLPVGGGSFKADESSELDKIKKEVLGTRKSTDALTWQTGPYGGSNHEKPNR